TRRYCVGEIRGDSDYADRGPRLHKNLLRHIFDATAYTSAHKSWLVMPGLVPGIHALNRESNQRRGWPGQARP
ncbi:MAG TPA: hypothetical protein VKC16_06515, partial [Xanthobacteraceae bacterium]|nr:hypothetical protein [Xanthobacteraceae bacterium]